MKKDNWVRYNARFYGGCRMNSFANSNKLEFDPSTAGDVPANAFFISLHHLESELYYSGGYSLK